MFKEQFKFYKRINALENTDVLDFAHVVDNEFIVNYLLCMQYVLY